MAPPWPGSAAGFLLLKGGFSFPLSPKPLLIGWNLRFTSTIYQWKFKPVLANCTYEVTCESISPPQNGIEYCTIGRLKSTFFFYFYYSISVAEVKPLWVLYSTNIHILFRSPVVCFSGFKLSISPSAHHIHLCFICHHINPQKIHQINKLCSSILQCSEMMTGLRTSVQ